MADTRFSREDYAQHARVTRTWVEAPIDLDASLRAVLRKAAALLSEAANRASGCKREDFEAAMRDGEGCPYGGQLDGCPFGYPGCVCSDEWILLETDDFASLYALARREARYGHKLAQRSADRLRWRGIDTAPAGEVVMLYGDGVWDIGRPGDLGSLPFATHWLPLPKPPGMTPTPEPGAPQQDGSHHAAQRPSGGPMMEHDGAGCGGIITADTTDDDMRARGFSEQAIREVREFQAFLVARKHGEPE